MTERQASGATVGGPGDAIDGDLFCQECGYNLRTLTANRCPECGHSLDTVRTAEPQIPWVHRDRIGRFRAYWKTVWHVMFRQRRFCEEMARPVSFADAQRFRWVTILHVCVPLLLATIAAYVIEPLPRSWYSGQIAFLPDEVVAEVIGRVWPVAVLHVSFFFFLAAATGVPGYFFHPKSVPVEVQNRAIALSYYACGPLAISAVPIAAALAAHWLSLDRKVGMFFALLALTVSAGLFVVWLIDLIHLTRRLLPQTPRRAIAVALAVPCAWLFLAGLTMVGIPAVIAYVVLMVGTVV